MSDKIKATHSGVEITYDVSDNKWVYTLRGKEKSQPSLLLAQEDIDKPAPKEKKPFKRFEVWYKPWHDSPRLATVTSLVEPGTHHYQRNYEAWIVLQRVKRGKFGGPEREETERKKVSLDYLYGKTEHNTKIADESTALRKQIRQLDNQVEKLEQGLKKLDIKPEDYA